MNNADQLLIANGIDDRWLVDGLRAAGVVGDGVELAERTAALIGTGQVGENVRIGLTWTGDGTATAPASVVLKVPSTSEVSRATAAATRTYVREVGFYRDLQPHVDIRTPTPYVVTESRETNHFVLLMEDIASARPGNQLAGCTRDEAELAMVECARLHGSTWGRDELTELDWVDETAPSTIEDRVQLYRGLFAGFADRYRHRLTADELDLGRWLCDHLGPMLRVDRGTRCLVHGDFRLDNLLFGTTPASPPLTTVDWQTVTFGHGANDVAYFLSAGLSPELRRASQDDLLATYRSVVTGYGIELDRSELWLGYQLGSASGYTMAVIASQIVGQTERGDEMFVTMARGAAQLMGDVDLPSLTF